MRRDVVIRRMLALPEAQQQVLQMRLVDELTFDEMAAVLGCARYVAVARYMAAYQAVVSPQAGDTNGIG